MVGRLTEEHRGRSHTLPDGRRLHAGYDATDGWTVTAPGTDRAARSHDIHRALTDLLDLGREWPDWLDPAAAELAAVETPDGLRYGCPCCGYLGIGEPPTGTYEICDVCGWEDDPVQFDDHNYAGGANRRSMNEVRVARRQPPRPSG